ncbi:MAG: glycosyltransferase family 2 protein [Epulopiscium sp.]|nr:glycosyltransferase family 2 protein [Candidatus Epulonipiscium sp.]
MGLPLVGIILVNYNGAEDTIECIKSLKKIKYNNYEVIIIDNKSSDDDYLKLKRYIDSCSNDIVLIRSKENLGFAGGNNIGIEYAINKLNCDYVLLLNNDTLVDEYFLDALVDKSERDSNIGVAGAKIYYYPESNIIWYAGGEINWKKFTSIHYGEKKEDLGNYNNDIEVDFITGCVMLIKKEVLGKVGYLPEEFFMYYEDFDFCIKVKDAGFKLIYVSESKVYHKISSSTGGEESAFSLEYGSKNRKKLIKKYRSRVGTFNFIYAILYFYFTRILKIIIFYLKGKKEKSLAIIKGMQ